MNKQLTPGQRAMMEREIQIKMRENPEYEAHVLKKIEQAKNDLNEL
jgi:hypothetical protein